MPYSFTSYQVSNVVLTLTQGSRGTVAFDFTEALMAVLGIQSPIGATSLSRDCGFLTHENVIKGQVVSDRILENG